MSVALITEGFVAPTTSGGGGGSAPVVAAVSPTPNTTPGAVGGMPSSYASARSTPIVITVEDPDGASSLTYVGVRAVFLDGTTEAVYGGTGNFVGEYVLGSSKVPATNGIQLTIVRANHWPGSTGTVQLAVGLVIDAIGTSTLLTTSLYYEMPVQTVVATAIALAPAPVLGALNHIVAALDRLPVQFREKSVF